jgi:6-pyruvoyltetrahydropterin/6-carboxytetrahydropterin synthase
MVLSCRSFEFDVTHWLPFTTDDDPCKAVHSHTYQVDVICAADPDARGVVVDPAVLEAAWLPLYAALDRRVVNTQPGLENPTAATLAPFLLAWFLAAGIPVQAVRVHDSATTWCEAAVPPKP